jgi:predicted tellurium resistance membrane protein TerC
MHTVRKYAKFWPTVFVIEMTDVAFAVDSILAALAFIPPNPDPSRVNPKLWVVMLGGFIGVVLMRFAAVIFIKLLEKFPRFEVAAYLLVTVIGLKLVIDWAGNHYFASPQNPHPIDFHNVYSAPFWIFWALMFICFGLGFIRKRKPEEAPRGFDVVRSNEDQA